MSRPILLAYQAFIGLSDTLTGAMLIIAPGFTLQLMGLHVPSDSFTYVSFIGAFVLSVGLACLYGVILMTRRESPRSLEIVWLLTAFTRASVAVFVGTQILARTLEPGWLTVALSDGACGLIQGIGLRKGWLGNVAR